MNIPKSVKDKLCQADTKDDLKKAIIAILEEYDFGILAEHERRIEKLEEKAEY